jgi:hypothetical protein
LVLSGGVYHETLESIGNAGEVTALYEIEKQSGFKGDCTGVEIRRRAAGRSGRSMVGT